MAPSITPVLLLKPYIAIAFPEVCAEIVPALDADMSKNGDSPTTPLAVPVRIVTAEPIVNRSATRNLAMRGSPQRRFVPVPSKTIVPCPMIAASFGLTSSASRIVPLCIPDRAIRQFKRTVEQSRTGRRLVMSTLAMGCDRKEAKSSSSNVPPLAEAIVPPSINAALCQCRAKRRSVTSLRRS